MIISSLLLRYAHETPHLPQPFRAAIFMNSAMPWSATESLGYNVTPLLIQHQYVPTTLAAAEQAIALEHKKNPTEEAMLRDESNTNWEDGGLVPPMMRLAYKNIHEQYVDKRFDRTYNDYRARRIFPEVDKVRIPIPTAHVLGELDPQRELGETMREMCDKRCMLVYKHAFGHEIPARSRVDLRKIAGVIEKTVIRSEFA